MRLKETNILWSHNQDNNNDGKQIAVTPWPTPTHLHRDLRMSDGACYAHVQEMDSKSLTRHIFILAMQLIIRDKLDPQTVHRTFCEIKEYRDGLSVDSPIQEHLQRKFYGEIDD